MNTSSLNNFPLGYRPTLDGIRGVAILFVMMFHSSVYSLSGGFIGVDIFFVLSGFLISTLIILEFKASGTFNFKHFYIRRVIRLMPAMLLLLTGIWAGVFIFNQYFKTSPSVMFSATLYTLFYSANWALALNLTPWPAAIDHFWSLAVEEQFYLFWPFLLYLMLKNKWKSHYIIYTLLLAILLVVIWRSYLWYNDANFGRCYFATDTRVSGLLIGCLLAIFISEGRIEFTRRIYKVIRLAAYLSLIILLIALFYANNGFSLMYFGGFELAALLSMFLIAGLLFKPEPLFEAVFKFKPLVWIGRISYGLYLWHGVVFYFISKMSFPFKQIRFFTFSLEIGLSILAATISFYLIEKKVLVYKKQYQLRKDYNKKALTTMANNSVYTEIK